MLGGEAEFGFEFADEPVDGLFDEQWNELTI
jgi:hypothetical protein